MSLAHRVIIVLQQDPLLEIFIVHIDHGECLSVFYHVFAASALATRTVGKIELIEVAQQNVV